MKKNLAIILTLLLSVGTLTACTSEPEEPVDDSTTSSTASESDTTVEDDETEDDTSSDTSDDETDEDTDAEDLDVSEDTLMTQESEKILLEEEFTGVVNNMDVTASFDDTTGLFGVSVLNLTDADIGGVTAKISLYNGETHVADTEEIPLGDFLQGAESEVDVAITEDLIAEGEVYDSWTIHISSGVDTSDDLEVAEISLTESFTHEVEGVLMEFTFDDDLDTFSGTLTNTTDEEIAEISAKIVLDNGNELSTDEVIVLGAGDSVDLTFDATAESDYNMYLADVEIGVQA